MERYVATCALALARARLYTSLLTMNTYVIDCSKVYSISERFR